MSSRVIQRLLDAEDLVRRRRADEFRRHVVSQRAARIDPNPHQIDAVIFALSRIPDGGCILADEVGLGKTIEAGLVVAQLRAEGARRVLIVTPKALLGQWKQELYTLFGLETREVSRPELDFKGDGVFLVTRDTVGSEAGAEALRSSDRYDLCVIDEAHEVFAGIYKRYDKTGAVREDAAHARMATRVLTSVRDTDTPVLLLTATPIQNSLAELWGLIHYVDPSGTLLGDLGTFRQIFCPGDDRVLEQGQERELQRRLGSVVQRTLRRQAQDFMQEPFMGRQARLFEYVMSPEEKALYDDVTAYLLEPNLQAFQGASRQLLLLSFHRLMASSHAALAKSLERVAQRLHALRDRREARADSARADLDDLEDDDEEQPTTESVVPPDDLELVRSELARVESFVSRADALPSDSKARALLQAVQLVFEQSTLGKSSRKLVVFTESRTTQRYLQKLLVESGLVTADEVTLFSGSNDSPAAARALDRWMDEVGGKQPADSRPSRDIAMRLALVHEFRHRSSIFISTEAGAKGLNLQFCNSVINYDLPWNPQRIEQRIGRCHRYGQRRDTTVINFIARDNEAQRLTFDILSRKLELFGTVLGATDEVLHEAGETSAEALVSALGTEFEAQLRRIYDRARTIAEVESELRSLRESIETKRRDFEAAQKRTEDIIQRRFDDKVKRSFRSIQEQLPAELEAFDRHVERVVTSFLDERQLAYTLTARDGCKVLVVAAASNLPEPLREGTVCVIGSLPAGAPLVPIHLGHPLVVAAIADARAKASTGRFVLRVEGSGSTRGKRGRLRLLRVRYQGFETSERLIPVVLLEGDDRALDLEVAMDLLTSAVASVGEEAPSNTISTVDLDDAMDHVLFTQAAEASGAQRERYEQTLGRIERSLDDKVMLLERQVALATSKLERAADARDAAVGGEQRTKAVASMRKAQAEIDEIEARVQRLRSGEDEMYRRWRERAHERNYERPQVATLFEAELELV